MGEELTKSYGAAGRLYCKYGIEEMGDKEFCMYQRVTGELVSSSSPPECSEQAVFDCPGAESSQEEMKDVPDQPKDSRSVNLPQFVKARSVARRAGVADTV